MRRSALPVLVVLLAAPAPPPPPVPVYSTFGRWFVACDNTRSCEARGFGETSRTDLRLVREAGEARPTLTLSAADAPLDPAAICLDGTPFPLASPAWTPTSSSSGDFAALSTTDPVAIRAFVDAARNALSLQLGPPGSDTATVPLAGFTAALLMVDAVQGRPGTASALVAAIGTGKPPPAPGVPKPPAWLAPPDLTPAETRALLARARALPAPKDWPCDRDEPPEVNPLDAIQAIAVRPCMMHAYQGDALVYILPRHGPGPAKPVVLPLPGLPADVSEPAGPDMTEPYFDPDTGRLSFTSKGRGLADCGLSATWVWHNGAFRLLSLSYEDQCGGSAPGDWATLFRTAAGP